MIICYSSQPMCNSPLTR